MTIGLQPFELLGQPVAAAFGIGYGISSTIRRLRGKRKYSQTRRRDDLGGVAVTSIAAAGGCRHAAPYPAFARSGNPSNANLTVPVAASRTDSRQSQAWSRLVSGRRPDVVRCAPVGLPWRSAAGRAVRVDGGGQG